MLFTSFHDSRPDMARENKGSNSRKRKGGAPQDTGGKKSKTETKVAKQAKARKVTAATARKTLSKNDKGKKQAKVSKQKNKGTTKTPAKAAKPAEKKAEGTKKIPVRAAKPEKKVEIVLKEGVPKDEELEGLGRDISDQWLTLGRRLKVEESKLQAIDKDFDSLQERGFQMLKHWRQKEGSGATYKALSVALKNKLLQRKDLAEKYCWKRQYSCV